MICSHYTSEEFHCLEQSFQTTLNSKGEWPSDRRLVTLATDAYLGRASFPDMQEDEAIATSIINIITEHDTEYQTL